MSASRDRLCRFGNGFGNKVENSMADKIVDELAGILARDNQVRAAEAAKKQSQEEKGKAAAALWKTRIEQELIPGIEPLADTLRNAGWVCNAETTPGGFKVMTDFLSAQSQRF